MKVNESRTSLTFYLETAGGFFMKFILLNSKGITHSYCLKFFF